MDSPSAPGRPRPVADLVIDALAGRSEEVARRWLAALVEARPLAEAGEIPVDVLAAEGPAACADVLEALRSDDALEALLTGPGIDLPRLCGATSGAAIVVAAEALRRSLQDAAAAEVAQPDAGVLAALAERSAHVCARLAAGAMTAEAGEAAPAREAAGEPPPAEAAALGGDAAPREPAPPRESAAPLWLGALERQIAAGGRFALLLAELDGADRLRQSEGEEAARELFSRAGQAVRAAVRRADLLAHEEDGRMWIIAPDAARSGADALAARVGAAVESAAARGVRLTASMGVALYPDDGRRPDELTGQAEEAALAARASGVRATPRGEPGRPGPRLVR